MPSFKIERTFSTPVCGIDEAGRGPLAGPVVAAAVILKQKGVPRGINDSKKLDRATREELFKKICQRAQFGIGMASVEEIDQFNILRASLLAMQRAYEALEIQEEMMALIDGNFAPKLTCRTTCVIGGDAKSLSIAAASILAKVTRDRIMCQLAEEYPHYGFERHVGYSTACHLEALQTHGATPHHRRSFRPVRVVLGLEVEQQEMEFG